MLIGISGKLYSGKDTVGALFKLQNNNIRIEKFANTLKDVVQLLTNCDRADLEHQQGKNKFLPEWGLTLGQFLQIFGTDTCRYNFNKNIWVIALLSRYNSNCDWVVTDVRFPNEAQAIKDNNGYLIRVDRNIDREIVSNRNLNHESEVALDNWKNWDYIIDNNGSLEELEKRVKEIYELFRTN